MNFDQYLQPTYFIDSDNSKVIEFTKLNTTESQSDREKMVSLYYKIRDHFRYNPYKLDLTREGMKASSLLNRNHGYCIEKASLLAATARVLKIPSRLGFANVKNHIGIGKLLEILKTDLLVFHGYTELFIENRWVKATPAFDKFSCRILNVRPLEFDGTYDSIFQEYNHEGNKFMEYITDHGQFSDLPRDQFISELKKHYPTLFDIENLKIKGVEIKI